MEVQRPNRFGIVPDDVKFLCIHNTQELFGPLLTCSNARAPHPASVTHLPRQRGNTKYIDHRRWHIPPERARGISSRTLTKKNACLT